MLKKLLMSLALGAIGFAILLPCYAAAPAKIATVAPIADLTAQADARVKAIEDALKDNDEYLKAKPKALPGDAAVLAVLAQAIAESEEKAAWQATAPDVREAALALGKTKTLDDAKKEFAAVKEAIGGKSSGAKVDYDWGKLARLGTVMDQITKRNSKFRLRSRKKDLPDTDIAEMIGDATVLSILALAVHDDTHEVKSKKAEDIELWKKFAKDYQLQMTATAAALKKKDMTGAIDSWKKSGMVCNDCHGKFKEGE
jgi:hypothetical protein